MQSDKRLTYTVRLSYSMKQLFTAMRPVIFAGIILLGGFPQVFAQTSNNESRTIELTNGMRLSGRMGSLPKMGPTASNLSPDASYYGIVLIDDDLREIFVSKHNVANSSPLDLFEEEFEVWQKVHNGDGLGTEIGPTLHIGRFNEFGRREVTIQGRRGSETVIQGITKINPRYVRLQGVINSKGPEKHWDVREAITSVPTPVLVSVLERQIRDVDDANERMRLVDFYLQAKKYRQAEKTLRNIARDFPGLKDGLKKRGDLLRNQVARQTLDEARLRFNSGQPKLANQLLVLMSKRVEEFSSAVLAEISELKKQIEKIDSQVENDRQTTVEFLNNVAIAESTGAELKEALEILIQEINSDITPNNVDRLSTFLRFIDDASQTDEQKAALALGGWVVGAGFNITSVGEAQSLLKTRALVIEYLRTLRGERRLEILQELETMETGTPQYLDRVVKHIKPPLAPSPAEISDIKPFEMKVTIPGKGGGEPETVSCLVQLPPEYDPYRRYPCILTLAGETVSTTPNRQVNFWCGSVNERLGMRVGQASRQGYIVVAPNWMEPTQVEYKFTARTHAIVLKSLRDAMRRFSIDTDRVFLTGHYAGAVAAWDIGQSHPEHWAGVIPISAQASKYINHYHSNGKYHMRWYFVNGGRDFESLRVNSTVWNKHMISKDFDTIVVSYQGRGTERFLDDLPNMFLWMSPQRRQFDVRQFQCATMRPWDNYFWWLEVDLSANRKMIMPEVNWETVENRSNWDIEAELKDGRPNYFRIKGAEDYATLWLSPGLIDFTMNVEISGPSGTFKGGVQPSRLTLLEDVRTRADRQHPYWAKIVKRKTWKVEE